MIKTHKNIRNVLGELLASEDYNSNLLEVLKKNNSIESKDIVSSLKDLHEDGGDLLKSKATSEDEPVVIKRNERYNQIYSAIFEQILENDGEFITELRLYKYLETIIINTQFILNLNFKISFLTQKKGLTKRTYLIAKAPFYLPDAVRQEARVYVRKNVTELYEIEDGDKIENYQSNELVMKNARAQLLSSMNSSIRLTIMQFHDLKNSLTYDSNIVKLCNQMFDKQKKDK
ncbi:hypothetical protein V7S77_08915 [Aquirufa ecclesiirivi]